MDPSRRGAPRAVVNMTGTCRGLVRIVKEPSFSQACATIMLQQQGAAVQGQFQFDPPGQGDPIQGQVQGNQIVHHGFRLRRPRPPTVFGAAAAFPLSVGLAPRRRALRQTFWRCLL